MSTKATKSEHEVVSREEWIGARKRLLAEEKELTRRSDDVARQRQQLPWVRIDKEYEFERGERRFHWSRSRW